MLYQFPVDLRKWSADPQNLHGKLFPGDPNQALPQLLEWISQDRLSASTQKKIPKKRDIILIGDVVSDYVLSYREIHPYIKYCISDEKTQQGSYRKQPQVVSWQIKEFNNPDGYVNSEIIDFIADTIFDTQPYLISIQGEEDLLVIAAVLNSLNAYIIYGQPPITSLEHPIPAGAVVIKVTEKVKQLYQHIFQKMTEISD